MEQPVTQQSLVMKHLYVAGRVQGVGFRYSMRDQARQVGVRGWCRNLADGRVEAVVCGTLGQMAAMLTWCEQGPPMAQVDDLHVLDVSDPTALATMTGFEIR
jgi:acylphosphatase